MALSSGLIGLSNLPRPTPEMSSGRLQKSDTSSSLPVASLLSSKTKYSRSDLPLAISRTQAENELFNRVEGPHLALEAEESKSFELTKTRKTIVTSEIEVYQNREQSNVQSVLEQIQLRDLEMRLYEQSRAVTGVQHAAHLVFQSLNGQRYAADMESVSEERTVGTGKDVSIINNARLEEREIAKAQQERSELDEQVKNREIKRAIAKKADEEKLDTEKRKQSEATFLVDQLNSIDQLGNILLSTKSLFQLANALHYITPENPSGISGLVDVIV